MAKAAITITIGNPQLFKKAVNYLKLHDRKLGEIIKTYGMLQFTPQGEMFQSLVESILGQQLAPAAASAITERVKAIYNDGIIHAQNLYSTPIKKLRLAGVSPQKIRYLRDLSSRVLDGRLDLETLKNKNDAELTEKLDEVLGIGPWTVQMLLIFTLGRSNVLPVDDLGIKKAIQQVYSLRQLPNKEDIQKLAKNWQPYCSVASLYLWKHKDTLPFRG